MCVSVCEFVPLRCCVETTERKVCCKSLVLCVRAKRGLVCVCLRVSVYVFEWLSTFYSDGAAQLTPPGLSFPRSPFLSLPLSTPLSLFRSLNSALSEVAPGHAVTSHNARQQW